MARPPDYPGCTDDVLAQQAGSPEAFGELHRRYHLRLIGVLRARRFTPDEADDLAQETWRKVWTKLRETTFTGNFRAWLFRIATNTGNDLRRKKKETLLSDKQAAALPERDPTSAHDDLDAYRVRFRNCLGSLSERHRKIVQLRCEGLTPRAIAEQVGLPDQRVHRLFHDAKQQLRDCLGVTLK